MFITQLLNKTHSEYGGSFTSQTQILSSAWDSVG